MKRILQISISFNLKTGVKGLKINFALENKVLEILQERYPENSWGIDWHDLAAFEYAPRASETHEKDSYVFSVKTPLKEYQLTIVSMHEHIQYNELIFLPFMVNRGHQEAIFEDIYSVDPALDEVKKICAQIAFSLLIALKIIPK